MTTALASRRLGSVVPVRAPCQGEGLLKLGMSHDPLDRIQTLHSRWFDFIDLDGVRPVEADSVREARRRR